MKLTVFGSTGGIGRHLVTQALEQGHDVTAFTRNPEKLDRHHVNLHVEAGDVLVPASVERATQGQNAVLCALGMPMMNKEKLRAKGTKNIVRAMEETGVKKLVCLSSLGVGDSRDGLPFHYKYLIFPLLMRHLLADHGLQENHVKKSQLDWVIVRPGNFTNGKHTGSYRHGDAATDTRRKLKISRADVAHFLLKQLTDETYRHKTPWISY